MSRDSRLVELRVLVALRRGARTHGAIFASIRHQGSLMALSHDVSNALQRLRKRGVIEHVKGDGWRITKRVR